MSDSSSKEELDQLYEAFAIFDKDGDGQISCEELHQVMVAAGKTQSKEQVEQMLNRVDMDGNGTVSFQEMADMMG